MVKTQIAESNVKILFISLSIITLIVCGWYLHQRSEHMKQTCDNVAGKFYTISFDEGTCIIGNDVVHLHNHN